MRSREAGIVIGEGIPGKRNLITDVKGVRVGHETIDEGNVHTGVTVVIPCEDVYRTKPLAAVHVINGFGKSAGLMQVEELGCIESPVALTNTLSVHAALEGLVRYTLDTHESIKFFFKDIDGFCQTVLDKTMGGKSKIPALLIAALAVFGIYKTNLLEKNK